MTVKATIIPLTAAMFLSIGKATGAFAGGFEPPAGCATFLTVQMKSCEVAVLWRCDAQSGIVWQGSYDGDGPLSVTVYDREFQWLDSYYAFDGVREKLADPGPDPISMSDLLAKGVDTFRFTLTSDDGATRKTLYVKGRDRLTGRKTKIDGMTLLDVDSSLTIRGADGKVSYATSGRQYVAPDMRLFLLGKEKVTQDGETVEYDNTPVDFIFPGEPGFNATKPLYECHTVQSGLGIRPDMPPRG